MARRKDDDEPPQNSDPAEQEEGEDITRCICGREELPASSRSKGANPGLFVQCERCQVWQHGFCVGFVSEDDVPDIYFCEKCEPSFHELRAGGTQSQYLGPTTHEEARTSDHEKQEVENDVKSEINDSPRPRKRRRVPNPLRQLPAEVAADDSPDNEAPRNTKRKRTREDRAERKRHREEDILLRVLQESAREARAQGLDVQEPQNDESAEAAGDGSGSDEVIVVPQRDRRYRNRRPSSEDSGAPTQNGSALKLEDGTGAQPATAAELPRRRKAVRKTRRINSSTVGQASAKEAASKPTRPRIPSARMTLTEMRRRIASIIEFSGRTQNDMLEEAKARDLALSGRRQKLGAGANKDELTAELQLLADRSTDNLSLLEDLTRRLISWQDEFGSI